MKKPSETAKIQRVRASLPVNIDPLLGQYVEVHGQRGKVDTVTTHRNTKHYHIAGSNGQRLDHVAQSDITVLEKRRWFR